MKKALFPFIVFLAALAAPLALHAYEFEPSAFKFVPECIWAPATGGGTWVTEIEITSISTGVDPINVTFYHGNGLARGPFQLHPGLPQYATARYANFLATIAGLDPDDTFDYYGKVGAILFSTNFLSGRIQVVAKTKNGNYGKTFPGLNFTEGNTATWGRNMGIFGLEQTANSRTFVGLFNANFNATYSVNFELRDPMGAVLGTFSKAFGPKYFMSFNPFLEAGVTDEYRGCFLIIMPAGSGTVDMGGIIGFGAIANNTTNDPAALLAYPFNAE